MTFNPPSEPTGGQSTVTDRQADGMPESIKAEWLERLRSGEINQGVGKLHISTRNEDGTERHEFCCLGVLCELAVAAGVVERVDVTAEGFAGTDETVYGYAPTEGENAGVPYPHYPPPAVAKWAGLPYGDTNPYVTRYDGPDPEVPTGRQVIANVNDEGATFEDIAKIIEKQF